MQRTLVTLLVGMVIGAVLFWASVMVTGGWNSYQLASRDSNWLERVERERCEPFSVKDIMFIRCPRFR